MAVRRVPTQRRSLERLARIAQAAGELCAEVGADAVTMEGIAARAGTSIGSLYQFFPNRDALLRAVAERYVADLDALLVDGEPVAVAALPLEQLVDAVLAPFEAFHQRHPGYFAILFAPQGVAALASLRGRLRARLVARVERLLERRAPALPAAKRHHLAHAAVEAGRALLQYVETAIPEPERPAMRRELRAMLVAYLAPWVE